MSTDTTTGLPAGAGSAVAAHITEDGTLEMLVDGVATVRMVGDSARAREIVIADVVALARRRGEAVQLVTSGVEGDWHLSVGTDGSVLAVPDLPAPPVGGEVVPSDPSAAAGNGSAQDGAGVREERHGPLVVAAVEPGAVAGSAGVADTGDADGPEATDGARAASVGPPGGSVDLPGSTTVPDEVTSTRPSPSPPGSTGLPSLSGGSAPSAPPAASTASAPADVPVASVPDGTAVAPVAAEASAVGATTPTVAVDPVPVEPLAPVMPDAPVVPVVADASDLPDLPDVPIAPVMPDVPIAPIAPDMPIAPVMPDVSVAPTVALAVPLQGAPAPAPIAGSPAAAPTDSDGAGAGAGPASPEPAERTLPAVDGTGPDVLTRDAEDDLDEELERTVVVPARARTLHRATLHTSSGTSITIAGSGVIGRRPTRTPNPVRFPDADASMSNAHAAFSVVADGLLVTDQGSLNGTVVQHDGVVTECVPGRPVHVPRGGRVDLGEQFFIVV